MDKKEQEAIADLINSTARFWSDIKRLESIVCNLVQAHQDVLPALFLGIRDALYKDDHDPSAMTEHILDYATHLLAIPTRYPPTALQTRVERMKIRSLKRWTDETAKAVEDERSREGAAPGAGGPAATGAPLPARPGPRPDGGDTEVRLDFNELRDEILMESLTAAWFALYFLGLPFTQIWERVRRMADERGGYPSGACVTKFVGDIHRIGRLEMARELKTEGIDFAAAAAQGKYNNCQTLVLSYMPFGLLRGLIKQNGAHRTPIAAHRLGNCYMLLQMRLYIREGFPIRYLVSQESLEQNWKNLLDDDPSKNQVMFNDILGWMDTVFPNEAYHQSVQLLKRNESIVGMSTCVLGRQVGVYVLDTARTSLPFAGNQLAGSLLLSYRAKLNKIPRSIDNDDNIIQLRGGPPVANETPSGRKERITTALRAILMKNESMAGAAPSVT